MARPASDIRHRILKAAGERFLLQGVDGASLRGIAKDAGTSIGMVYYYFKTKDELFLAVVEDAYGKLLGDLAHALGSEAAPEQQLERLYARIAHMDEREFKIVRMIMREALISSTRLTHLAKRFERGHVPLVLQAFRDGVQSAHLDDRHPAVLAAATMTLGMMPQILHRLVSAASLPVAGLLPSREATAEALAEVLLFGIAGPALRDTHARARPVARKGEER